MGGIAFYLARDIIEPLEHSVEIPEGPQLSKRGKLALSKGYSELSLINLKSNPQKYQTDKLFSCPKNQSSTLWKNTTKLRHPIVTFAIFSIHSKINSHAKNQENIIHNQGGKANQN